MHRSTVARARVAVVVLVGTFACSGIARAQALPPGVADASAATTGGERVLHLSAEVPASVASAWAAFATEEGFRAWAVPLAPTRSRSS